MMIRTQNRPLATGKIKKSTGYLVSGSLALASGAMFMHLPFPYTAAVAGGIWVGYSLMYTPMK